MGLNIACNKTIVPNIFTEEKLGVKSSCEWSAHCAVPEDLYAVRGSCIKSARDVKQFSVVTATILVPSGFTFGGIHPGIGGMMIFPKHAI